MTRQTKLEMDSLSSLAHSNFVSGLCALATLLAVCGLAAIDASAASSRVKLACARDYYAHCSKFSPNSPETRACMRAVGDGLSKRCVDALVADGEVSSKEVSDRVARITNDD
jgi:hypothetical protein